ncbi:uncharacterized protein LOC141590513 [Silene latifolia]|uniref:uncharacterized protein LOC141590513 n=1 Tax=Silene latifolia TaxID=37657 RepID=UPI003D76C31C
MAEAEAKMAEAEAILVGIKEARRTGCSRIIVEGDCLSVIEELRSRKRGRQDVFLVYDDIFLLCNSFESVVFSFVRRDYNRVAHALAHVNPWSLDRREWSNALPPYIDNIACRDLIEIV